MVPKPMTDSGLKKKVEEPDVIPTDSYRKIRDSLKKVNILPTIGGTGSGSVADESVGSFYNPGDNRIARAIIKEDSTALFTTSKSFDSNNWDCFACPVKHSVLGGGAGGAGGPSRPVIIICDQNFPAILPSATGECAAIARLEDATFEELGDFLSSFAAKDSLPPGTLILVGSLSELKRGGISPYLAACTQMIRRLGNRFGDSVTVIPFVPPPMGGTKDPTLIRSIADTCAWFSTRQGYQLSSTMADLENMILKTGRDHEKGGIPRAVHYPAQYHIPFDISEYKGSQQISPGRECLPLEMPAIPPGAEKLFIHSLIEELNSGCGAGLDPDPNLSRSKQRPAMYSALRLGGVEKGLFIGGSNADKLANAVSTLGMDVYRLVKSGWKISKDAVDQLLPDLRNVLNLLPADTPIILFCLDNSAFMGATEEGSLTPMSKSVKGDKKYHAVGDLVVAPEQSIGFALEQLKRILEVCGDHPVYILCPLPRYFTFPCCRDPTHMLNSGKPDFFLTLLRGLRRLGSSIKNLLQGPVVVDTMELVCGHGYTEQQAETICRAGWTVDAVHPTAHTFAKMALNLMETITPGVRGREQPRPRQAAALTSHSQAAATTSPGRKRARSETPGPAPRSADRSTERSRKWPQVREQRRAATYDEEFFHSISSSSRGGHDQPSHSRGQQGGQRGGYNQTSPARGNLSQTGRGAGYTPHYSFTPPQYYAPRIYLGSRGGRGRGERGGRGGRGVRLPKKWY
jgi:hypothetical protein